MNNLGWLFWKEYRHNRLVVFVGLILLFGPHLVGLGIMAVGCWKENYDGAANSLPKARDVFSGTALTSLALSQLTIALVGGNVIAGERVDRSSEFLLMLPIARSKSLVGKVLLGATSIAIIWSVNGIVLFLAISNASPPLDNGVVDAAIVHTLIGVVVFCCSWFWSSMIANPTVAVCGGLLTPILASSAVAIWYLPQIQIHQQYRTLGFLMYGILCAIASVAFALGTWRYLRQMEP